MRTLMTCLWPKVTILPRRMKLPHYKSWFKPFVLSVSESHYSFPKWRFTWVTRREHSLGQIATQRFYEEEDAFAMPLFRTKNNIVLFTSFWIYLPYLMSQSFTYLMADLCQDIKYTDFVRHWYIYPNEKNNKYKYSLLS